MQVQFLLSQRILRDRLMVGQRALIPSMVVRAHLSQYRRGRSIASDVRPVKAEEVGANPTCHPKNYGNRGEI